MAVRRTIVSIGDVTAIGRPVAELTAINPALTAAQTDMQVWNIQAAAWQALQPGVNSQTSSASDAWSYESLLREELRDEFPDETLYLIKHAVSGSTSQWLLGGSAHTALISAATAAANQAVLAGDTISIDLIICSIQVSEHTSNDWRGYGARLRQIAEAVKSSLEAIDGVSLGTLRDDAGMTPVVILEPHFAYTGSDARLLHCRMQATSLENSTGRIAIARSHGATAESGGSYSADSIVDPMTRRIADAALARAIQESGDEPVANMVVILGDSIAEGWGVGSGTLPTHQTSALAGVQVWAPSTGSFATLQIGVNNLISVPNVLSWHSWEIGLADRIRDDHNVWLVKGTQISSVASDFRGQLGTQTPPLQDPYVCSWGPGYGQLADMAVGGWLVSAISTLRDAGYKPKLELVVVSVGVNDALYRSQGSKPSQVKHAVASLIARIRDLCTALAVDTSALKFVLAVPASYAVDATAPYDLVDATDLEEIREGLFDLQAEQGDVYTVDLSGHEAGSDGYHLSAAGVASSARAIYDHYLGRATNEVAPLFAPTMTHLKKALRLSGVGDDNDALAMIDNAVQTAKSRFFSALGQAKIDALRSIAYTATPVSHNDYLRIVASETEIKIVRAQLIRSMPLMFMDGASPVQSWQQEAAFREGGYLQVEKEIRRLEDEIVHNLAMLSKASLSDAARDSAETFPTDDNALPGDSIFKVI